MTIKTENWLGEYTSTIGTGDITLGGAIDGFAGFSNVGENVDVYYTVMDALDKETGIGTLTGGKLVRKDIHATLVDGAYVKNGSAINLSGDAQVYGTANAHFLDYVQAVANAEIVNTQAIAELKALQINGHALTSSFNLTAADVGAHPDSWMPSTEALNVYQKAASDIRYLKTQDAEQVAGLVMRVGGAREQRLQQSINDVSTPFIEALRRSYDEASYNLVDGSFEAGGTLVNANDVLLQERTGKAFSGPAGTIAAGTNPASGGFVDRSGDILRDVVVAMSVANKAELQAITTTLSGLFIRVASTTGADNIRVLSSTDDGTGVLTAGGMYANVHITKPCTIYMSQLFVAGGSDQTDLIFNKLPAKITAEGVTNVVLDTGDISIFGETTLPEVYNKVTFSGIGKLLTKSRDNILQRIPSEKTDSKKYHGQYNLGAVYNAVSKARIMKAKEFRVVLFGDSISVGSDYDSSGSIPTGDRANTGVDNAERNNCLAATIFNELCSIMPAGVRVKFYSRSIGGLAYGNIDQAWDTLGALWSGRAGVVAGRSWRDCVLALNPDLVIHSMGMNESPTTYIDNFKTKWTDYLSSSAVQKSVTFDQAILTTPNPNFIDAEPYGDFRKYGFNASKFFVAAMQRYIARKYNYSLIDVAFNSYLKRYGFDCRSVNFSATAQPYVFPDGASSHVCVPGEAPSLSVVTPTDLPFYWSTRFTLNSATASNTTGYDFKFTAGSIIVQFAAGSLILYSGNFSGAGLFTKTVAYTLPSATDVSVRVTVTPVSIYLYIDDVLTIAANDVPFTGTLPMQFDNYGGNAAVTVKSGSTFSQQFARYGQDAVTNGDYYGVLGFTSNPNGGGVNHPSSTMLAEIYIPPVREFLTALLSASVEYDTVVGGTAAGQMVYVGRIFGKQYNRVSIKERGSTRETIITMNSASTWTVNKNTGGVVSVYIDPVDLAVFIYNPSDPVYQIEYTGDWIVKRVETLGLTTPRGTLLATVP